MKAFGVSDIGLMRKINEDALYFQKQSVKGKPFICVIADGMGGHNAGEIASRMAVTQMVEFYKNEMININCSINRYISLINEGFASVNKNIFIESACNKKYSGMGTTLIVTLIIDKTMIVGHVGDSRVYFIRDGNIKKITTDHSYVAELVKNGTIKPEEANSHPQKNLITRAVGTEQEIKVDINTLDLKNGDYILMCTDGLSNMIKEEEIINTVLLDKGLEDKCNILIKTANEKGGHDNATVIIIEVEKGGLSHDR